MSRSLMRVRSGGTFDLTNPKPDDVVLSDIIIPLCNMPRFNSQSRQMISVAAHSLALSRLVPQAPTELRAAALLHDAAEAYIGDIIRPVRYLMPPEFRVQLDTIELGVLEAIEGALRVPFLGMLPDVKKYDDELCGFEMFVLHGASCINHFFEPEHALKVVKNLMALSPNELASQFFDEIWELIPASGIHAYYTAKAELREAGVA